jgi:hypothetical protein
MDQPSYKFLIGERNTPVYTFATDFALAVSHAGAPNAPELMPE